MPLLTLDPALIDILMPDLVGHDRRPAAFIVYLCLLRRASPPASPPNDPAWSIRMSHQSIAAATGLSRSAVQSALTHLNRRQLILTSRSSPTATPLHKVQRPWQRLSRAAKS